MIVDTVLDVFHSDSGGDCSMATKKYSIALLLMAASLAVAFVSLGGIGLDGLDRVAALFGRDGLGAYLDVLVVIIP
tara:strand:+ start:2328 stop:2555 length:228 start_codon:yes stop_codon:yes gene_type:complete